MLQRSKHAERWETYDRKTITRFRKGGKEDQYYSLNLSCPASKRNHAWDEPSQTHDILWENHAMINNSTF